MSVRIRAAARSEVAKKTLNPSRERDGAKELGHSRRNE